MLGDILNTVVDTVTQPIRDGADVVDGLLEGEIRTESATRLAIDLLVANAISEALSDDDD